jgi:hypothetical protein
MYRDYQLLGPLLLEGVPCFGLHFSTSPIKILSLLVPPINFAKLLGRKKEGRKGGRERGRERKKELFLSPSWHRIKVKKENPMQELCICKLCSTSVLGRVETD